MNDLEKDYKTSLKVFRIILRWFLKLTNQPDREYIIAKLQSEIHNYESNGK